MATITRRSSDVYTTEKDFSQILITRSSSIVIAPIISTQGRITPQRFTNPNDAIFEYGDENPQVSHTIRCLKDYFTEGNVAHTIRIVGQNYMYAGALLYMDGTATKIKPIPVSDPENIDWKAITPINGVAVAYFYWGRGPGSRGNQTAISISSSVIQPPSNISITASTSGGILEPDTYSYRISAIERTGEETIVGDPIDIVVTGVELTNSVILTWDLVPTAIGYRIYGRHAGEGLLVEVGGGTSEFIDTGLLTPDFERQPSTVPVSNPKQMFTINAFDLTVNPSSPLETFNCTLMHNVDTDGMQTEIEDRINPFSRHIQVKSFVSFLDELPLIGTVEQTQFTGGDSGTAPTSYDVVRALNVFYDRENYPANIIINGGLADPIVQQAMTSLAEQRNFIALLDTPSTAQKFQQAIDYRNLTLNINSSYAALFTSDGLQADTINSRQVYTPMSGWVAALMARTERIANSSYSPAGMNRGRVPVLRMRESYDKGQADELFRAQVNYFKTITGQGIFLWEQQTLTTEYGALSWINVRHLLNIIKESSYDYLIWALQEPNTDALGRVIVNGLSDYLQSWKNADGIDSFRVVSDYTNNFPALQNAAIRLVQVAIVPVLATHEIQLEINVSKAGVSFDEILNPRS